ncbi:hypothetical protein [Adonisia turfae]|uniref:Uncharacterized protein n=1 Tax=Adonisia turfae CCMR0081 TaxID=2292702 RepID=A0A6M0RGE0_9CYAN|nr:hypothetical protein [Adonisia turfae]NEZ55304.1 hypothetical protein [Adonisia turfae CCMR0081]
MALIKLLRYKLEGGNWPNNATISFRFVVQPIGPNLASTPVNQWINCPSSSQLTFSGSGSLQLFVNGAFSGMAGGINPSPTPRINLQANFNTRLGIARVRYSIL